MKRFVNVIAFMLFMVGIKAQVRDAFDGILPVLWSDINQRTRHVIPL